MDYRGAPHKYAIGVDPRWSPMVDYGGKAALSTLRPQAAARAFADARGQARQVELLVLAIDDLKS